MEGLSRTFSHWLPSSRGYLTPWLGHFSGNSSHRWEGREGRTQCLARSISVLWLPDFLSMFTWAVTKIQGQPYKQEHPNGPQLPTPTLSRNSRCLRSMAGCQGRPRTRGRWAGMPAGSSAYSSCSLDLGSFQFRYLDLKENKFLSKHGRF